MKPKKYLNNERSSRLYRIWLQMRNRCVNPIGKDASKYYDRGISVCKEWDDFKAFEFWALDNGYTDVLTIERENNDGNYEPSNCSWIPIEEQAQNKRTSIKNRFSEEDLSDMVELYENENLSVNQIAKIAGVNWNVAKRIVTVAA